MAASPPLLMALWKEIKSREYFVVFLLGCLATFLTHRTMTL